MCGVMGRLGTDSVVPHLLDGTEELQSRGYDSVGLAHTDLGSLLSVFKVAGRIDDLRKILPQTATKDGAGISHNRWSTTGSVTTVNAHPHLDCRKKLAIVHNGNLYNFSELKRTLEEEGHIFASDTDSEVLAHLIEKFYFNNLEQAVASALKLVQGTFGLLVIRKGERKIVAANRGQSIILGHDKVKKAWLVSSQDIVMPPNAQISYLENDQIATITDQGCDVINNLTGQKVQSEFQTISWGTKHKGKNGFKYWMEKEIFEQPEVVKSITDSMTKNGEISLDLGFRVQDIENVTITACGTSWHAALIGEYLLEEIARVRTKVDYASQFRSRKLISGKKDLVIAITQSGETADTLAALLEAKRNNARTLALVNVRGSLIAREADSVMHLDAGPEIGVASTKAFTAQVAALFKLALFLRKKKGLPDSRLLEEFKAIHSKIEEVLTLSDKIKTVAKKYAHHTNCYYLGQGVNFPLALEGALKLKEISYVHAEGYPAAEIKHGPIALIDKDMPVIFIATEDKNHTQVMTNMGEVHSKGGVILAIVNEEDGDTRKWATDTIVVPRVSRLLSPFVITPILQFLAYYVAEELGRDIDKPRNLAKSVTV